MCIKIDGADSEMETIKCLMSMSLNAIISDVCHIDIDEINMKQNLIDDLHIDSDKKLKLQQMVAEYFDDYQLNISDNCTIQELHNNVVLTNFKMLNQ